jgi:DNA-binding CsgD family transcriptional regulator
LLDTIDTMPGSTASPLPWAQPAAARGISATVGEIAAVGLVGQLAADAGPVAQRGERALDAVAELIPCDGADLASWDPVARTHRHVAGFGVPPEVLSYCSSSRILADPGYRYVRERRVAHRRCDVPGANDNEMIAAVLVPAGFYEGVTACLFHRGRYAGVLNIGIHREQPATERAMIFLSIVEGALARLVDVTQSLHAAVATLPPSMAATVVHADGRCEPLPERPRCDALESGSRLIAEARRRALRDAGAHAFLWHQDGQLWRVLAVRFGSMSDGAHALLVGAEPTTAPLSLRELQVLAALADGHANPAIGARLCISPHTVARHVEHILEKLGVASRVEAATCAVREGLILASSE